MFDLEDCLVTLEDEDAEENGNKNENRLANIRPRVTSSETKIDLAKRRCEGL